MQIIWTTHCKTSRHYSNKKEYPQWKINDLETNSETCTEVWINSKGSLLAWNSRCKG